MTKTFDDIRTDQSNIRNRIIELMKKEQLSIVPMARNIGIAQQTFRKFIVQNMNIQWTPLCKIYEYCEKFDK